MKNFSAAILKNIHTLQIKPCIPPPHPRLLPQKPHLQDTLQNKSILAWRRGNIPLQFSREIVLLPPLPSRVFKFYYQSIYNFQHIKNNYEHQIILQILHSFTPIPLQIQKYCYGFIRELLYQYTSQQLSQQNFINKHSPLSVYCGYDPTAESLHLGNLVSIIMMTRLHLQLAIRPIFLLGGATGLIGDPSGKKQQRKLLQQNTVNHNLNKIKSELQHIHHTLSSHLLQQANQYGITIKKHNYQNQSLFLNNYQFYEGVNFLQFLREIGKHFRINSLINKETIANRLKSDQGISYTQFSYTLIQAYDFYTLYHKHNCILQFGGSDQWGNITNGCQLIKKINSGKSQGYGITMPLLLSKKGEKFGKSQGNALYLNPQKTPLSAIYEYFFNASDEEVENLLFIFTFFSESKIQQIMKQHLQNTERRIAQRILAEKVISYLGKYTNIQEKFFKLSPSQVEQKDQLYFKELYNNLTPEMKKQIVLDERIKNLPDLLFHCEMVSTKKEARRDLKGKGFYLNNQQIDEQYIEKDIREVYRSFLRHGKYLAIRKGKKKYIFLYLKQ